MSPVTARPQPTARPAACVHCVRLHVSCGLWDVARGGCVDCRECRVCRVSSLSSKLKYMILPAPSASVRTTHVCTHGTRYSARFAEVSTSSLDSTAMPLGPLHHTTPVGRCWPRTAHCADTLRCPDQPAPSPTPALHPSHVRARARRRVQRVASAPPPRSCVHAPLRHHCGTTAA